MLKLVAVLTPAAFAAWWHPPWHPVFAQEPSTALNFGTLGVTGLIAAVAMLGWNRAEARAERERERADAASVAKDRLSEERHREDIERNRQSEMLLARLGGNVKDAVAMAQDVDQSVSGRPSVEQVLEAVRQLHDEIQDMKRGG